MQSILLSLLPDSILTSNSMHTWGLDMGHSYAEAWRLLRQLISGEASASFGVRGSESFARLAATNRMSGLAHIELPEVPTAADAKADLIRKDYIEAAGLTMNADQALSLALGALDSAGIACLPFKGALFRHLLYPDPAVRISVDQDLLVRSDEFSLAGHALEEAGFNLMPFRDERPVTGQGYHERSFTHPSYPSMGCLVELHRGFSPPERYPVETETFFDGSLRLESFCERVGCMLPKNSPYAPSTSFMVPAHALVHQFVHNANHNFYMPLASAVDAKWIVERWRPDWDTVISLARRWRVSTAGYFTLRIAADCLGTKIPADVLVALKPAAARRLWLEQFIATEGLLRTNPNGAPIITFFRYAYTLRIQQALIGFPLIDGPLHAARFGASYLLLRARDLLASLSRSD